MTGVRKEIEPSRPSCDLSMIATPMLVGLLLLLLMAQLGVHGLAFTTANHDLSTTLWDTWLYRGPNGWVLNYLAAHRSTHMWNSLGTALSSDGVHFADTGISVRKDCASSPDDWEGQPVNGSDCSVWMVSDRPCSVGREGGKSLVIEGPSLVILEGKACNPL